MQLVNLLNYPNIIYGEPANLPPGQYALANQRGANIELIRDPLGCNKLFYGFDSENRLIVANRISRALESGVPIDQLLSCPPGHHLSIEPAGTKLVAKREISSLAADDNFSLAKFQAAVARDLDLAMAHVGKQFNGATVAICLSGGLDSTCIAAAAKKHFKKIFAISFSYISDADFVHYLRGGRPDDLASTSDDFQAAHKIARSLNIHIEPVFRPKSAALTEIIPAVRLCQDWRDFNVHCAIVNCFLAEHLRATLPDENVIVLTGDLMNEFVCDYHEEVIDGTVYYPQPRVPIEKRRRFFVRGLDAGDREIGVFNAFRLPVIQIFAMLAQHYMAIPGDMIAARDAKHMLNGHLLSGKTLSLVNASKQRAQVGGKDGGTLGAFHRAGVSQEMLKQLWVEQLPESGRGISPTNIIQFGRYRSAENFR